MKIFRISLKCKPKPHKASGQKEKALLPLNLKMQVQFFTTVDIIVVHCASCMCEEIAVVWRIWEKDNILQSGEYGRKTRENIGQDTECSDDHPSGAYRGKIVYYGNSESKFIDKMATVESEIYGIIPSGSPSPSHTLPPRTHPKIAMNFSS